VDRWLNKAKGEKRGAGLVEFAIILPLLIVMLFGILEASWAFAQQNDVRHGTREAARLAAVNFGDVQTVAQEACARMDVVYPATTPVVTITPISTEGGTGGLAQITISSSSQTITGMLDGVFGNLDIESTVEFRIEQPLSGETDWWVDGAGGSYMCP
jgi:Flp pilus assembly protein TadG